MKYLGITPSVSTLALSLAAWSEVSVQAPLLERFQGGGGTGDLDEGREFVRLIEWIKEWVGEKRTPDVKEVVKWTSIMGKIRNMKR